MKKLGMVVLFVLAMVLACGAMAAGETEQNVRQGLAVQTAGQGGDADASDKGSVVKVNADWEQMGNVLALFLVLSLIFETAMTPIFNWTYFARFCEGKGVKTPLVIILAYAIFSKYNLDIIANSVQAFTTYEGTFWGGKILSAMLIAGGSDGIFRIFTKLGIRNPQERKDKSESVRRQAQEAKAVEEAKKAEAAKGGAQAPKPGTPGPAAGASQSGDIVQP
ncbi:hypothetical protein SAMN02745216_02600 [Desulfatibacillum alkenivorans DSM 16219]|uniref:Uncharacterized protein n=1 Tax=Desulfatibacillum alkenivorans DSM 16219 TaxID=1121393 RepID=A0A1M6NIZ0_9BACT|nr:hypothetical protein [Desulfatibacillum alkenivorans]SHJ95606.1 hypothetical protein SAMN02745216_02600 [Desulfatibacillum alkenivorans DSM 16219]